MTELFIATSNRGKLTEIRHELDVAGLQCLTLRTPSDRLNPIEIIEDRPTFIGNAIKKARSWADATGLASLADDSGLCVDALGGEPGVRSARYAGEPCDDVANNNLVLAKLSHIPASSRQAQFLCAMALALPGTTLAVFVDKVEGVILTAPRGNNGFGYDPLFLIPHLGRTTAELTMYEKSQLSHRGKALRRLLSWLTINRSVLATRY
ncbi:MAG: RdgB/HAM1 family non-canonical purine NTP pyrophosphatase [Phycisphaerales bacterium]|nr:RdgB/HAM1 family non-canonical purine NTP pyrophosphatase [Phycisphaerales bacterium]